MQKRSGIQSGYEGYLVKKIISFLVGCAHMDDEIKKGLNGVIVDKTSVSKVMPEINALTYRGYDVRDLCENCKFDEVAYLLLNGNLPNQSQLTAFNENEKKHRAIDPKVLELIEALPSNCHPMDAIRTVVSMLGTFDETCDDLSPQADMLKSIGLLAKIPDCRCSKLSIEEKAIRHTSRCVPFFF